jgi:Domain of unknown function (DUF1877)
VSCHLEDLSGRNILPFTRLLDALHYVLSEQRRRGRRYTYGDDVGSKAIMGSETIAPHIQGGQVGAGPARYLPSADVLEVAAFFELTQPDDLHWWYDPAKMVKQGAYRVYATEGSEALWDWIVGFYQRLRARYLAAAEHGEGMLVTFV